jgi:hypothetical protein
MNISLIVPTEAQLRNGLLDHFATQLTAAIRRNTETLRVKVGLAIAESAVVSPEYDSLVNGRLKHELGVINAAPILDAAIAAVVSGIRITPISIRRNGSSLAGGIRIEILRSDLTEISGVKGGEFVSEGGFDIPWLMWLTTGGDELLVMDYHFETGFEARSRTGDGIMVGGGTWKVPDDFSGTPSDNWLSRSIIAAIPAIQQAIVEVLSRGK